MKKNTIITSTLFCSLFAFILSIPAHGQAFRKGAFDINLTEGWTNANYSTDGSGTQTSAGEIHNITGKRDPIQIEYGLSRHWGIGLSTGTDFYCINPQPFYGFSTSNNRVKATTSEFTIDGSYHFCVTDKTDVAFVASWGSASVAIKGTDGDNPYQYNSAGAILRMGVHGRFFFSRHFGLTAMATMFSETCNQQGTKSNISGILYSTTVSGTAFELGFCYRLRK